MAKTKEYYQNWWKSPRGRYHRHIANAKLRGVVFRLTFDEWWSIWEASGRWDQRGRGRGQYVMARTGDQGAYELGSIKICLVAENVGESNRDMDHPTKHRSAVMKAWWAGASKKKRAGISRALSVNNGSHRPEVRAKQRAAALARWARYRGEIA